MGEIPIIAVIPILGACAAAIKVLWTRNNEISDRYYDLLVEIKEHFARIASNGKSKKK